MSLSWRINSFHAESNYTRMINRMAIMYFVGVAKAGKLFSSGPNCTCNFTWESEHKGGSQNERGGIHPRGA